MIVKFGRWLDTRGGSLCLLVALTALAAACKPASQADNGDLGFRVRHTPPSDKDILEALLASGRVRLTDESCVRAGTDAKDETVGAYISGFLAEMRRPTGGNHIVMEHPSTSNAAWTVRVMLRHAEGEDVWSWGIEFAIRKPDGLVDIASFRCIGAG